MIISCNSCKKKFVVPDRAITSTGRIVQCGACGNKWKQFPDTNNPTKKDKNNQKNSEIKKSNKKKIFKKKRKENLYSPEYLAKKHGINLNENFIKQTNKKKGSDVPGRFYSSLIIFFIILIALLKTLHLSKESIINLFPFSETILNSLFETTKNIFEILINLI